MSKRKKQAYACVIAVVALGMVVDRMIGMDSGPAKAVGSEQRPKRQRVVRVAPVAKADAQSGSYTLAPARFPAGLTESGDGDRNLFGLSSVVRDALLKPLEEVAGSEPGSERNGPTAEERRVNAAERFSGAHTLSAVVCSGTLRVAVVDGQWLRVGQEFDGCTVSEIHGGTVVFNCAGEVVQLSAGPGGLPAGAAVIEDAGNLKSDAGDVDTVVD